VLLSSVDSADPGTVVAAPSTKVDEAGDDNGESAEATAAAEQKGTSGDEQVLKPRASDAETISSDADDEGDSIHDIADTRTFLVKVSCRSTSLHWLELADLDLAEAGTFPVAPESHFHLNMAASGEGGTESNQGASYYGTPQGMTYAAQQHQNALKSRQQYFFQMQQQHQQQYAPQAWSSYSQMPGQVDSPSLPTAGEAAAQWATMYYQQPVSYPLPAHESSRLPSHTGVRTDGHNEDYHAPPDDADADEPDVKKQRVV
jgi:hypothetical protein